MSAQESTIAQLQQQLHEANISRFVATTEEIFRCF